VQGRHAGPLRARDLRLPADWNMPDYIAEAVEKIREQVGTMK
jgi:hypothetical protein